MPHCMKYCHAIVLLFSYTVAFSQNLTQVNSSEKEIGTNILTQKSIKGIEISFPYEIYEISGIGNNLTVQLRPVLGQSYKRKGLLIGYDIGKGVTKWQRKIQYATFMSGVRVEWVWQIDSSILLVHKSENHCLNNETGKETWALKDYAYLNQIGSNRVLFFQRGTSKKDTNNLKMLGLTNGKILWQKKYKTKDAITNLCMLNDTTLLLSSNGLSTFNVNDGRGWNHAIAAGKKTKTTLMSLETYSPYNVLSGIISQPLIDSNNQVFIAGKDVVSKINLQTGDGIWETQLQKNITSKSHIFQHNNLIIMVNFGYVNYGSTYEVYGKPFISAFDKNTGAKKYLIQLPQPKGPIIGIHHNLGLLTLVLRNSVRQFNLDNGNEIHHLNNDDANVGIFRSFMSSFVYIKSSDTKVKNVVQSDSSKYYVLTNDAECLVLNEDLKIQNHIPEDQLFINYADYDGYKLLGNKNQTIIIDSNNTIVARLGLTQNSKLIGHYLFEYRQKRLMQVNLIDFIKD